MIYAFAAINHATYGGVYYCDDFTTTGDIAWVLLPTTGLPSTLITHFRVDYSNPLYRQYVKVGNEIYTRTSGAWTKILDLTIAATAAGASATNAQIAWLYTDPTVAGSVYATFMTDPNAPAPQSGTAYVLKSLDYGANWTGYAYATGRSRILAVEAIGDHIWASAGKAIITSASIYYSPDGGANWNPQVSSAGSSGTANLRINPHAGNKVYAWGDGAANEWTYSAGFTSRAVSLDAAGFRSDNCWFDPVTADRVVYHSGANILYSTDNFVNVTNTAASEASPAGVVGPYNVVGSTELLSGAAALPNKSIAYFTTPTDAVADERGGAAVGTPPYTNSVPNLAALAMYGIWWGMPAADKGVFVYADEQEDITDIPTYIGLGTPLFGDRSSWRDMYADGFDIYHAQDVQAGTPQLHAPWPAASGEAPVSDGTKYVATDIATQAELNAHAALPDVHHAAVTLDVDAAVLLDLNGQEIGLDTQMANLVFAGPASGAANEPIFRALVGDDIPALDVVHEHVYQEVMIGDGAKTIFITANEFEDETTQVTVNGLLQRPGAGFDFAEDAGLNSVTFSTAPESGDVVQIAYIMVMT